MSKTLPQIKRLVNCIQFKNSDLDHDQYAYYKQFNGKTFKIPYLKEIAKHKNTYNTVNDVCMFVDRHGNVYVTAQSDDLEILLNIKGYKKEALPVVYSNNSEPEEKELRKKFRQIKANPYVFDQKIKDLLANTGKFEPEDPNTSPSVEDPI